MRGVALSALVLSLAAPTLAQSLETTLPNNGRSDAGAGMFMDLTAATDLSVIGFEHYTSTGAGLPTTIEVYVKNGSYVGFDGDPGPWTLHDTVQGVGPATTSTLTAITLNNPIDIAAGETMGVYLVNQAAGGMRYTGTGTLPPQTTWQNTQLTLFSDVTRGGPPFFGTRFQPRCFAGVVHYDAGAGCYADCDGSGSLDFFDFLCFQNEFASASAYADCDASGTLDFFDFLCFQNEFAAGCP